MLDKISAWCDRHLLLRDGDRVVIACSGGADSLALTDILLKLSNKYRLVLAVAHLDHMMRGEASKADARFVENFCAKCRLPFYHKVADVPVYAKENRLSLEEAARIVRYDFLRETAKILGGAKIATGHHKDDQAETVILHLFRGAGSAGIGGIRPVSRDIIRPLLSVTRKEIEAYCLEHALQPQFDSTNLETYYLRNRIRLELLPELKAKFNPGIEEALCRSAELIGNEHDFIRQSVNDIWQSIVQEENNGVIFLREKFCGLHIALKRELLRTAIEKVQKSLKGIGFDHIERTLLFAQSGQSGKVLELPGNLVMQCQYETMYLFRRSEMKRAEVGKQLCIEVNLRGITAIPQMHITVKAEITNTDKNARGAYSIVCDLDKLILPVYVRQRKDGDRFQPSGLVGSKKLKDFFIDRKVLSQGRDLIPIFCDQAEIIWVGGYRQSQTSRVTKDTTKFLHLTILED